MFTLIDSMKKSNHRKIHRHGMKVAAMVTEG